MSAEEFIVAALARGLSLDSIEAALRRRRSALAPSGFESLSTFPGSDATLCELTAGVGELALSGVAAAALEDRYEDLGPIGAGGMGEVRRVRDKRLGRCLARKTSRFSGSHSPELAARFREEAQATAQLQHPGIVPVHDFGVLPDGRLWFTMKEVTGRTFASVIQREHSVNRPGGPRSPGGKGLRRLVEILRQVCDAVGFAHSRGVVHRDLKPGNVMVGAHGEVIVLDWGLAKISGAGNAGLDALGLDPVATDRGNDGAHPTRYGAVMGTPAYMCPEQAMGEVERLDARTDVYALGAILYEVLSGLPPYEGQGSKRILDAVREGPPRSLRAASEAAPVSQGALPSQLVAVCEQAMARSPKARFGSASELAGELQAWLDGARRRDEGLAVVTRAGAFGPEARGLRARASDLRAEAKDLLSKVESWQPETAKVEGWALEDAAAALERKADAADLTEEALLRGALTHSPDLPEAHAALARRYRFQHAADETARRDPNRSELLLRQHANALPEDHPDRSGHAAYLRGDGALSLVTDPPGAEVLLYRYVQHNRRLVPRFERSLGLTPLRAVPLSMGSYLCLLRLPQHVDVRYPVFIERCVHWDGVPPEGGEPHPIVLPRPEELGPDDCYVPAGWFRCGGDPQQERSLPARRVWVEGKVFRRHLVTNRSYIGFLDDLVKQGRAAEALRHAPRERAAGVGQPGDLVYGFDGQRFSLRADADGDAWDPEFPVFLVTWHAARAFAESEAARSGQPWGLPCELAWEKAARGVDGRWFPWGDHFDPSWACMIQSHKGRPGPVRVGLFDTDESPYGLKDMAGNAAVWCEDAFLAEGPSVDARGPARAVDGNVFAPALRSRRGGCWYHNRGSLRLADRYFQAPDTGTIDLSLRLSRPYPQRS